VDCLLLTDIQYLLLLGSRRRGVHSHLTILFSRQPPARMVLQEEDSSKRVPRQGISDSTWRVEDGVSAFSKDFLMDDTVSTVSNPKKQYLEQVKKLLPFILLAMIVVAGIYVIRPIQDKNRTSNLAKDTDVSSSIPPRNPEMATEGPTLIPFSPTDPSETFIPEDLTFVPGDLSVTEAGLLLSTGLRARVIGVTGQNIQYFDGTTSSRTFHGNPDFGATFPDTRPNNIGGWVYVSNSEMNITGQGGVGAITFDKDGNVIDYRMVLEGTTMNCGGGRTPW